MIFNELCTYIACEDPFSFENYIRMPIAAIFLAAGEDSSSYRKTCMYIYIYIYI